jgi:hypothetical protein
MDVDQVKQTVELILQEYHYFKPEDFKSAFSKAMKGHYGKLYDRLDGQIIMGWLNAYDDARTEAVEELMSGQNRTLKKLEAQPLAPVGDDAGDLAAKHIQIWKERLERNKVAKEQQVPEPPIRTNNPIYQMHQRWMRQFDTIYQRQNKNYGSIRYIRRYGRMLDISAYLEHKQSQYTQIMNKKKLWKS